MSVYELHLGSWRPGLGYREVADQLIDYVAELGYTHVEFLPLAEHPFGGSWGYQVTGYYAADQPLRLPRRPPLPDRPPAPGGHRRDHGLGARALPEGRRGRSPGSTASRCTSTRTRAAASSRTGAPTLRLRRNSQVRNFLVANALYWLEEFHVDGLRVDAVASMLYLDYSRDDGEWLPNIHGGRENLEAIGFLQEVNATAYKRNPGIVMIAEESTSCPGVTAPTSAGGLGFGLKWNMGWMHDSLAVHPAGPDVPQLPPRRDHVLVRLRVQRELPAADQPRRGRARQGLAARQDAGRPLAASSPTCAPTSAFMWAHPGKQLLFMGQEFGAAVRVERGARPRLVDPRPAGPPAAAGVRGRDEPHLPRERAAVGAGSTTDPRSRGSARRTGTPTSSRSSDGTRTAGTSR